MSFNYTPPPLEVIRAGQLATCVLYAALLLVPKVKPGALIGGLGSVAITCWVTSHASGDMGSLSMIIEPPLWGIIGALIGGAIPFVGQTAWRFFRRSRNLEDASASQAASTHTKETTL